MKARSNLLWVSMLVLLLAGAAALRWAMAELQLRLRIGEVAVLMPAELPVRATIARPLEVSIDQRIAARVRLGELAVPIDETIEVPLKLTIDIPIDTEFAVDQNVPVSMTVPLDLVLTERELDLSKLEVPIDTDIYVDDEIDVDALIPIDTEVTTALGIRVPVKMQVPVHTKLPVRQKVHVRDTLHIGLKKLRVPLKMNVPVRATLPLKQRLRVKGNVRAPIDRRIRVPIRQTLHPKLAEPLDAVVELESKVPATLGKELQAKIAFDRAVPARLGTVQINAEDVAIGRR